MNPSIRDKPIAQIMRKEPGPNTQMIQRHISLGQRYQNGERLPQSNMMALVHFSVAAGLGADELKPVAQSLAESLTPQQTRTAALLATVLVTAACKPAQEPLAGPGDNKSFPDTDRVPSRRI